MARSPSGISTVAYDVAAAGGADGTGTEYDTDDADTVSSREPRRLEILERDGLAIDHRASAPRGPAENAAAP